MYEDSGTELMANEQLADRLTVTKDPTTLMQVPKGGAS